MAFQNRLPSRTESCGEPLVKSVCAALSFVSWDPLGGEHPRLIKGWGLSTGAESRRHVRGWMIMTRRARLSRLKGARTQWSPVVPLLVLLMGLWVGTAQAQPFAYISNAFSNSVSVIDTATNTVVATV